ncbi:MAG: sugar transferase [Bacteroidales bacterium]|nr:sugar transferase [Bacteroidales bacterium]
MILKYLFDRIFAAFSLIILSPFFLIIFILHKVKMPEGKFIFRQTRIGMNGKPFRIFKIRTMKENSEEGGSVSVYDDERILPFGKWLRETKVDTIFELINILIGDMSFVGPRPDVPGYADKLEGDDRKILTVRPGITGPASLKYRHEDRILAQQPDPKRYNDEVIYPDKVKINLQYLENWSFFSDVKILWKTFFGK